MRRISPSASDALVILGDLVRAGRVRRGWTIDMLAQRVGVSDTTISKVERGDPSVAVGTVFEAATLVGVALYDDQRSLVGHAVRTELSLLPQRVRPTRAVDNDF